MTTVTKLVERIDTELALLNPYKNTDPQAERLLFITTLHRWTDLFELSKSKLIEMEKALETILEAHYNLYKCVWGENSNPTNDLAAKPARAILQALNATTEGEGK